MRTFSLREAQQSQGQQRHWLYNALDTIGTRKVHDTLQGLMNPATKRWYKFELAAQTPAMKMASRGILVDTAERDIAVRELKAELKERTKRINAHPQVKVYGTGLKKLPESVQRVSARMISTLGKPGFLTGLIGTAPNAACRGCGRRISIRHRP